jgi:hypothetical protein
VCLGLLHLIEYSSVLPKGNWYFISAESNSDLEYVEERKIGNSRRNQGFH